MRALILAQSVAADASTYTYNAANKSYTFDAIGVVSTDDAATALKGYLGASNTGKIKIGGTGKEVNIAKRWLHHRYQW